MSAMTPRASRKTPAAIQSLIEQLGRRIRMARLRRNKPLNDLIDATGLSRSTLLRIEAGTPGVSIEDYFTVIWALGIEGTLRRIAHPDDDEAGKQIEANRLPKRGRSKTSKLDF